MSTWELARCISIRQPWADPVVDGHKTIENRSGGFTIGFRGIVGVHASGKWSERGQTDGRVRVLYEGDPARRAALADGDPSEDVFVRGAVIGVVDIVDAHYDGGCCRPWGESVYVEAGGRERRRLVHLVLENARRLREPVFIGGKLGLWPVAGRVDRRGRDLADAIYRHLP